MQDKYTIYSPEKQNIRLDQFLASNTQNLSRSKIKDLIISGYVKLNTESVIDPSGKVAVGSYYIHVPLPDNSHIKAKDIKLDIIYEDDDLLVINKQSGLTVHPGAGNHDDTLVNALIAHYGKNLSTINGADKAGIVHRLDRNTTGLMVVAKNDFAHLKLSSQLQDRTLSREYLAICYGMPLKTEGEIRSFIDRSKKDRTKMTVTKSSGKEAITNYKLIELYQKGGASLIKCKLATGRTHQIRVHLAHIGHSVIGDQVYGKNQYKHFVPEVADFIKMFDRQALHSFHIAFIHPRTNELMEFSVELPVDMQELVKVLL